MIVGIACLWRTPALACVALLASFSGRAPAQEILYRETFGRPEPTGNQNVTNWGWQRFLASGGLSGGGGTSGDGDGGRPIDLANTESAGPNADGTFNVYPEGWQYMDNGGGSATNTQVLSITNEYSFNPADAAPMTFRWWQGAAYPAGADPLLNQARIAVRVGTSWYVSSMFFTNTPVGAGADFDTGAEEMSLAFDPAPANWLTLSFDGSIDPVTKMGTASTVAIAMGAAPAEPITGVISGFGIYRQVGGSNMRFDNFTIEGKGLNPGDVDKDDDVDLVDYGIIRDHFRQTATMREEGDLNGDGTVDFLDYRRWKDNYPFPPPPAGQASDAVPEPASGTLFLLGAALTAARRRRRTPRRGV